MRRITILFTIALLVLPAAAGWQIAAWELANTNLQEEMRDMGSQAGSHIGFIPPMSDDEARSALVRKAKEHGIELKPNQVRVWRKGSGETSTLHLAAEYSAPVNLVFFSFHLHFTPSSDK